MQAKPRWPRKPEEVTRPTPPARARAPRFAALDTLQVGEPFNPYQLFVYGDVLRAVLSFADLNDGQKNLWILLADQCQKRGFDKHSQGRLAAMLSWNPRKFRRNIRVLKKLKFVHVEWNLGEQARTWLLYHPLFALCSPLGKDTSVLGLGQKLSESEDKSVPNMDLLHGSLHGRGNSTFNVGTGIEEPSDVLAREKAKISPARNPKPAVPITNRLSTLSVSAEAKSFWFSLPPAEKKIRHENGLRAAERVAHYRQYINETDRTIAGQARREVKRYLGEVRALGFFIPGFEPQEKA